MYTSLFVGKVAKMATETEVGVNLQKPNLDPMTLQEETAQDEKERLVLEEDDELENKYFFFQLSDHNSPDGKLSLLMRS